MQATANLNYDALHAYSQSPILQLRITKRPCVCFETRASVSAAASSIYREVHLVENNLFVDIVIKVVI